MEKNLQQVYEEATKKFEQDPSDSDLNTLNKAKEILESYYEEKTRGVIIRVRSRCRHEYGERSTKYVLNLEKHNHVKKHIRKLLINGSITSDPFGILNEQKRFSYSLYKSNVTDEDRENRENGNKFLNNLNIPRFSEEQKQSCEKEIFVEEITAILNSFENKKSPGNDGIPIEFYKSCGELISDPFMECVRVFQPR